MSVYEEAEAAVRAAREVGNDQELPHWINRDGSVNLSAWRDEVAARASGGWGVWYMRCWACSHPWVAVAPICAGEHPMECPACGRMEGVPEPERGGQEPGA
jgi:hypothetical protein